MSLTTTAKVWGILGIIWALTLGRSILIMFGGSRIFKKASRNEKSAMHPFANLFDMLEIVDISTFFGILLFVPGINIIILVWMSYKLGYVFNTSMAYRICLMVLPIIFYPALAFSNRSYKLTDEEYFKALDSSKSKNLVYDLPEDNVPPTSEEVEEEHEEVDSVFKSDFEIAEKAAPYKAVKIDLLGMEKLKDNDMDDVFDKKEEVPHPAEVKPEEKKNELEMIDL